MSTQKGRAMALLRGRVWAGTSGWAYPSWKPGFYPKEVPARRFLEHYAGRLSSVEVNYTFRKLPTAVQMEGWLSAVPESFRFSFKAPEAITHRKRLRACDEAVTAFLKALEQARAAGKMGLMLFQLPPNFKADVPRLEAFLALPAMREAGRVSFEFRHASWFCEETYAVLRAAGAAVCIAENEDLVTPEVQTAEGFASYRLRMPGGYEDKVIAAHARRFKKLAGAGREVFAYYKHEDAPTGALAAEAMLRLVGGKKKPRFAGAGG